MYKYKKLPIVIDAIKVKDLLKMEICNYPDFIKSGYMTEEIVKGKGEYFILNTLEGEYKATINDYICCGIDNEFYPCKISVFEKTYSEVKDGTV